jgi:hypothetical protein
MSIMEIAALAEIAGSMGVIATLIYLTVQVRQNTKSTRADTSFSINSALSNNLNAMRSDGEFAEIWLRGCKDLETLSDVERLRFTSHLLELLNLATYIDQLEQQNISATHIDFIPWVTMNYRDNPGIRAAVDSIGVEDFAGGRELFERITNVELAAGANIYR